SNGRTVWWSSARTRTSTPCSDASGGAKDCVSSRAKTTASSIAARVDGAAIVNGMRHGHAPSHHDSGGVTDGPAAVSSPAVVSERVASANGSIEVSSPEVSPEDDDPPDVESSSTTAVLPAGSSVGWTSPEDTASFDVLDPEGGDVLGDRKSTRLNSSHVKISYAVFCL